MSGSYVALRRSRVATAFVIFTLIMAVLPLSQITPTAAQDTATYKLVKYNCTPGYDPSTGDANAAFQNCTAAGSGVSFTLQSGDQSYSGGTQQTDNSGNTSWQGIPLGTGYSVSESIPSGYNDPWVYCEISGNPNNSGDTQQSFFQATGGNMDVGYSDPSLTAYTQASCYWFDWTSGQNGQQGYGSGTSVVHIQKYACAPDYDYGSANFANYQSDCTKLHVNVPFTVNNSNPSSTGSNDGIVEFSSLPAGQTDIRLLEQPGYAPVAVYCVDYETGQNTPTLADSNKVNWTDEGNSTYKISWNLTDNHTYYCYWYDIPTSGGNTVYLYKFYCAPDYDWQGGGYQDLLGACTNPQSDVQFQIENGSYSQQQTTDGSGTATWGDVPDGNLQFSVQEPSGYQVGRIFCGYSSTQGTPPTQWDEYSYSDGWSAPTQTGQYLYCVIFDIPSSYGTVYLYKFYCAPDFDWQNGAYDYLFSGCTNPQSDVYFEIHNGSYSQGETTDSSGSAAWDNVPGGDLEIVEQTPTGYTVGRVFCGTSSDSNTFPSSMDETPYSEGIHVPLASGQYLFCVYFNIPSDYGTVYLYKYYCDADFDWEGGGYEYLLSGCTSPNSSVDITLNAPSYSQTMTTDSDGLAVWSDVPDGNLTLEVNEPSGYKIGRIFCGEAPDESSQPSAWQEEDDHNDTFADVSDGQYLYCYIFDIPTTYGTIYFYKYYCDASFDWQNGSYDYLYSGCTNPQEGVQFDLTSGSYASSQLTDSSGAASWTDAPQGDLNFVEKLPEGYQVGRIFCGYSDTDGTPPTDWTEYDYSSGSWTVPNPSGQYVYCYIFDIPTTYGTVYLYKYYCDADFDWQNGSYDYLYSGCTNPQENVQFDLSGDNYSQSQTTDSSGAASWTDAPPGDLGFVEQIPDGYQIGRIFCGYSDSDSTPPTDWTEYDYSDGWTVPNPSGQYVYCYIFDVPTTYWTVHLYKYYCEADFDWQNGSYDYLYSGCTSPQENVQFDLSTGSYAESQTTASDGTANWTDVPQDAWVFQEHVPDGYQVGRIFCGFSDTDGTPPTDWTEYDYSDGWTVDNASGKYLYCYIFDVPTTYWTVHIYKYYCDADYDWQSGGYGELSSGCTNPHADVQFDLSGDNYDESQTTDASGLATWTDVPLGGLHFVEHFPDGYQIGRIFCGYSDTDGTPPSSVEEMQYSDGWDVKTPPQASYLYCYVFDVPATYYTIHFYKYYCDANFDWQNGSYDYLYSGCTSPQSDVDFDLSSGSYASTQTTDSDGAASWTDVPDGQWHFEEHFPDGYQVGRIFCGYSDTDGTPPTDWTEYDYSSGWDVSSSSGQYLYCYIFDVPYTYGTVYFYKYYCEADYDWQSGGYDELYAGCTSPQENVDFSVDSGSYSETQTTDSSGAATWSDVPQGSWHFTESFPDGYQIGRIFCGYSDTDGTPPTDWTEYDYSDGWDVDGSSHTYLYCYIFDVPQQYGWVTIYKYTCPADFDYSSADQSYYESSCTDQPEGIDFEVSNPSYGYQEDQSTDSSGTASWSDVPSGGGLSIYELPNSYAPIAVWCGSSTDGSDPTSWDQYTLASDGGLGGLTLEPNTYFICKWFNKPYDNPQVWIYKYNCEQSADWHWNYHQLLSGCTTPGSDVEFAFGQQNGSSSESTTDDQGKGHWEDLTPGTWYWEESFPSGYDGAIVYCQWVTSYGSGEYQQAQLDGAKLWLVVDPGDVVTCYWFDFPTGYGPPVATPTSGGSSGGGTSGGGTSGGGTSGGGTSGGNTSGGTGGGSTSGAPPLTSNVPKSPAGGGAPPTGGGTTGQQGNPNAPATLVITKSTCPEGYDIYADKADVAKDCTDLTKDIDFDLTSLTPAVQNGTPTPNEPVTQTTGDDGKATWTNLKAGPYLIAETLPEGTGAAFIWTCKSDKRQFQTQYPFTPFSYAGPNGQLGITLIGGEKLECTWYDIPSAPASVTIHKFECPSSPVIVAQCDPAGAGVQFQLAPAEGVGAIIQLTTDDSGNATAEGVAGAYTLAEQGGTPCLIDSDAVDAQGHVTLTQDQTAELKVYNCGGGGS